ncbi:MAG: 5-formyltetrahydrofolate cyclo-ligase [Candidatus Omnitrophota bacterium]|jgi:5-formyltetrahydrofolate cyclo-ligase
MGFFKEAGLTKQRIRSKILLKLNSQKEEDRKRKSRIIKEKLFRSLSFKKAKRVMFYISFGGEVDTREMIEEALKLGKIIAVPACQDDKITLRPCIFRESARLKKGRYGVCEPAKKKFIDLEDIDLVIVPGIAFDRKGGRLGRGKGCYDRFLKRLPCAVPSIGLAFDFQILPDLPAITTDVNVRRVIFA